MVTKAAGRMRNLPTNYRCTQKQVSGRFLLDTQSDRCIYYIAFAKEQRIRSEPCVQPCCARAACRSGGEAGFEINSSGTSRGKMLEVRL